MVILNISTMIHEYLLIKHAMTKVKDFVYSGTLGPLVIARVSTGLGQ